MSCHDSVQQEKPSPFRGGQGGVACSKLGGGFLHSPIDPVGYLDPIVSDYGNISEDMADMIKRFAECTGLDPDNVSLGIILNLIESKIGSDDYEGDQYFYHPDHLGSSSFITDANGDAAQHLQYLPFGESFIDQRNISWNTPYTFSAKEKDLETGYSYFGARYYYPDISIWLSVDPLADKYPNISPFAYVLNNPIKYVDLWGLIPTPEEGAEIAEHVYNGKVGDKLIGGWEMKEVYEDKNNPGYRAGLYERMKDDGEYEYVMTNAGTDFNIRTKAGRDDVSENFEQPFGGSEHMHISLEQAKNLDKKYGKQTELTFVGHSKGGAEAAGNALATNRDALLFNPAAINAKAYDLDPKKYTANMTAYIVKGEILNSLINSWAARPIDKIIYLPKQSSNPITNHLMPAVKAALKEYYYKK